MTSRERVQKTLAHQKPDRIPRDFGATPVTGVSASFIFKLRQELGLKEKPIPVYCPYQMLGEVDAELRHHLGVDIASIWPKGNLLGFDNTATKPFTLADGTPVLVQEDFNTTYEQDGSLYQYACGDRRYPPSAVMPPGGFYFDAIIRAGEIDEDTLDPRDNVEEFQLLEENALRQIERETRQLHESTDYALVGGPGGTGLGDIAFVPGPMLLEPKGIRDIEEWYISPIIRPEYIHEVFTLQTDIALKNLEMYHQAVGERISVINLCGADFGSQHGLILPPNTFKEMYLPYYKKMTDWIHRNTSWKVFKHCCGAIEPLLPGIIEAGIDIINPVQISADGMTPEVIKEKYGDKLVFWGGGVDTQQTLPYGTPTEVYNEVKKLTQVFGKNGGYVFNTVHNTQANVPVENFLAMIEALG